MRTATIIARVWIRVHTTPPQEGANPIPDNEAGVRAPVLLQGGRCGVRAVPRRAKTDQAKTEAKTDKAKKTRVAAAGAACAGRAAHESQFGKMRAELSARPLKPPIQIGMIAFVTSQNTRILNSYSGFSYSTRGASHCSASHCPPLIPIYHPQATGCTHPSLSPSNP